MRTVASVAASHEGVGTEGEEILLTTPNVALNLVTTENDYYDDRGLFNETGLMITNT